MNSSIIVSHHYQGDTKSINMNNYYHDNHDQIIYTRVTADHSGTYTCSAGNNKVNQSVEVMVIMMKMVIMMVMIMARMVMMTIMEMAAIMMIMISKAELLAMMISVMAMALIMITMMVTMMNSQVTVLH